MMKKGNIKNMAIAAIVGGSAVAGYMYIKQNPKIVNNVKSMLKDMETKKEAICSVLDD